MTPETIAAIGQYIVIPICVVIGFYFIVKLFLGLFE